MHYSIKQLVGFGYFCYDLYLHDVPLERFRGSFLLKVQNISVCTFRELLFGGRLLLLPFEDFYDNHSQMIQVSYC